LLFQVHDLAYGFQVGAPPTGEEIEALKQDIAKLKESGPPAGVASLLDRLADMTARLEKLKRDLPEPALKALEDHRDLNVEFVINYHEFSIPHLIDALERDDPLVKSTAAYCLHQIAWRFFRYRAQEGEDPEAWSRWWRKQEAELERRSRK
jgi:hypothetical protein